MQGVTMTAPLLRGGKTLYALCRWHRRRARPAALEASYSFDDAAVRFTIVPHGAEGVKGPWETATISEQALRDAFGARGGVRSLLEAFDEGASPINAKALACLRDHPGQAVFLTSADFASVRGGDEVVDALAAETVR
jgi:hypothetical protein